MASKFQSRLVGTIILAAVGVIFLPDVLDGKKAHYKEELAEIPIKPDIGVENETFEVLEPVAVQTALPAAPVTEQQVQGETSESQDKMASELASEDNVAVKIEESPSDNDYQKSAWIIQLMALKNADNADRLVVDLQKRGYQAHTKKENNFTRVFIGPDTSKVKLEKQIKELEKITGSKGQLMKFKPLNP